MSCAARPNGREEVSVALIDAAADLITDRGLGFSVREVASRAGVNHGLVHTYFGSKEGLIQAAFDELSKRTAAQLRPDGFPPLDLAEFRDAEMVRAMARLVLDPPGKVGIGEHPIADSWRAAIARTHPDMADEEIRARVAAAAAMSLGWALFAEYFTTALGLDEEMRCRASNLIGSTVADIGKIPDCTHDQHNVDQHNVDQHNVDQHNVDQHNVDQHNVDQPNRRSK